MKKGYTIYYSTNKEDDIEIKVNEDVGNLIKPILVKFPDCWREPAEQIRYLEWVIKEIEKIK